MALTGAERIRNYRTRRKEAGLFDSSQQNRPINDSFKRAEQRANTHFTGCDGEGCGVDTKGRQLYMLFRMGDRELFTGAPLSTWQLLDFICDHSRGDILVGFAFGYDVTMILRDLPEQQQRRLFQPRDFSKGRSAYVWYKDFDIDYLPRQYFRVKRVKIVRLPDGRESRVPIPGSQRTIYETFGFFQKSFLKSIQSFEVGTEEERERIARNKAARSEFTEITQEVRDYCALECRFLSELMDKLRTYCHAAGIVPKTWNGAGKLASALHSLHHTPKASDIRLAVPSDVLDFANMAYYGGRFEITRIGDIREKVYEYDICSAYPDAMRKLPCLIHGTWRKANAQELRRENGLFVASVRFRGRNDLRLGGLPVRTQEGHLCWPRQAGGIYWSPELRSAEKLGMALTYKEGWIYEKRCDCRAFDWIEPLYNYRREIGSQGAGYPIKLGINSLYGKLAQRKGNGIYHNMVWAGLITANTRAKLNSAIALNPDRIIMIATDAVYSLDPLDALEVGDNLGQWERNDLEGLFIVQPGLYWCPAKRKRKSRGLSGSFFESGQLTESFEQAWHNYRAEQQSGASGGFPECEVPVPGFIGLKLALSRNKPDLAGTWINDKRVISFNYRNKRFSHEWHDGHIITTIKPGSAKMVSLPHKDFLRAGGAEPWENARLMLEEQPDYIDLSPPFED